MANMVVKRGEVYYADLSPVIGPEKGGIRPVVIIQNDIGNRYAPTVVAAAITSQINKAKLPIHVEISTKDLDINEDSVVLLEQIRTLDKRRLKEKIGSISKEKMKEIDKAWCVECGISTYNDDDKTKELIIENYYKYKLGEFVSFLEEDLQHEFKEIKGNSPVDHIKSNVGEYITSFLNSDGGTIYYGISDNKEIKGVLLNDKQKDQVRRSVVDAVSGISPSMSPDNILLEFVDVYNEKFEKLYNMYVLEIHISNQLDKKEIFLYKNEIQLRVNGVKKKLQGREIVDYIRRKTLEDFTK